LGERLVYSGAFAGGFNANEFVSAIYASESAVDLSFIIHQAR
jgi:hypothetical protein